MAAADTAAAGMVAAGTAAADMAAAGMVAADTAAAGMAEAAANSCGNGSGHDRREMEAERRAFSARAASWLVAKNFIDGSENRPHVFVRKIVVDRLSLAPRLNETIEAEAGELLRYGRLA